MSCAHERHRDAGSPRGDESPFVEIGRAAEEFGRRVARDATRFAERIAEHANELARDISRDHRRARHEWRRAWRDDWREARQRAERSPAAEDVREMFADVRGLVGDVLDGVDDLVGRIFGPPPEQRAKEERSADAEREPRDGEGWQPIVSNREAHCAACGTAVHPGDEAHLRRSASGVEVRCAGCGPGDPAH
jgi:hypothetical protein